MSKTYDVVMLDVRLPDGHGLDALPKIKEVSNAPEVIIITGMGDPDGAELAINCGAWDYIEKPSSIKQMTLPVVRALEFREGKKASKIPVLLKRENIIGNCPKMLETLEHLAQAAATNTNVLITGETGTGKELFARAIHENSSRANERFVVIDCAALPGSLVESILFGHEKGAFTGADKAKEGLIQQAERGTLFLDEVGELPLSTQKAFLRVIQERQFRPVGSKVEKSSNFRLVAATNRNLEQMVEKDSFRSDFLFRLQSFKIVIPPLRERLGDIKDLIIFYTNKLCDFYAMETKGFAAEFFDTLGRYDWPGNIRELANTMEQVLAETRFEPVLFPYHLPNHIRVKVARTSVKGSKIAKDDVVTGSSIDNFESKSFPTFREFREDMELQYFKKLMSVTKGSKKEAIELSGLSRQRLYEILKNYNL